jgi:hypothetical protein
MEPTAQRRKIVDAGDSGHILITLGCGIPIEGPGGLD